MTAHFEVDRWTIEHPHHPDRGGYHMLNVRAGNRGTEHVVPEAGEDYAYDRDVWARRIQVSVSPSGRSVRVWVDGVEVPRQADSPA